MQAQIFPITEGTCILTQNTQPLSDGLYSSCIGLSTQRYMITIQPETKLKYIAIVTKNLNCSEKFHVSVTMSPDGSNCGRLECALIHFVHNFASQECGSSILECLYRCSFLCTNEDLNGKSIDIRLSHPHANGALCEIEMV